ncbi:hypothetical protein MTO96_009164 [Rhipicephalus appendiculatus]
MSKVHLSAELGSSMCVRIAASCSFAPARHRGQCKGFRDASLPRDVLALDEILGCKGSVSPCSVSGSVSFLLLAGDA